MLRGEARIVASYLVTGCAGFIGWRLCEFLLNDGHTVLGIDNLNPYYDVRLKKWRLDRLQRFKNFKFFLADIEDKASLRKIFDDLKFDAIFNLAARAGVAYSLKNPHVYFTTNVLGNLNLIDLAVTYGIKKYILASTSSVYAGSPLPFTEDANISKPISPYAASKRSAELTCYTYHYHYGIDVVVLRYFTVYGPCGRPDMSIMRFIKWIDESKPVIIYGDGSQSRDFTYVDDVVRGTIMALSVSGFEIVNIGGGKTPTSLLEAVKIIEAYLGKKAILKFMPKIKADLDRTMADITKAKKLFSWQPEVSFEDGLKRTIEWYIDNKDWLKDVSFLLEGESEA